MKPPNKKTLAHGCLFFVACTYLLITSAAALEDHILAPTSPTRTTASGIHYRVNIAAPEWAQHVTGEEIDHVFAVVATYARRPMAEVKGVTVVFRGEASFDCDGVPAQGCYDTETRTIELARNATLVLTGLPHEALHAFIGDPCHASFLWMDFEPVGEALGVPAYRWRHWNTCLGNPNYGH